MFCLIVGTIIGLVTGYLGSLMFSKRMSLVAGPLGHLALPGIALALLYNFDVSLGAFIFIILGIILIWLIELRTKLPLEALVAIVFSFGVALAFLFLPLEKAEAALIGDISKIGRIDGWIAIFLAFISFFLILKIFPKLVLINISEDLAKVEQINLKIYNLLYLFTIAIMVGLGVKLVGGLLTAALVAIPSSSARNLAKNLFQYQFFSGFFGFISCLFGILLSYSIQIPAGLLIILISTLIFFFSVILKNN